MKSEYAFLLEALQASLKDQKVPWTEPMAAPDWCHLFEAAELHRVLPLVYEAVFDCPAAQTADPSIFAQAKGRAVQSVFLQTTKTAEFLWLYQHLQAAGAEPLVVKGIICRSLYPRPDLRMSSDEDLLIPPEQFSLCHQAMLDYGMVPADPQQDLEASYEVAYRKPGSPLYIELHKHLFPPDSDAYGTWNQYFKEVHQNAVTVTVDGVPLKTMHATEHLFYLICHAFKHFLHSGFGIRQVCDIALFANTHGPQIDWDWILHRCQALHAEQFTAALLQIARKYLTLDIVQACLPLPWQGDQVDEAPLLDDILDSGIYGGASLSRKHSSNMTLHAVTGTKAGHGVLCTIFPSAKSLAGRYPYLRQHPYLLPVAWTDRILKYRKETSQAHNDDAKESLQIGRQRIALLKEYGIIK